MLATNKTRANLPGELTSLSAAQLSSAIRSGQVSCVETMQAYLERIQTFNPVLNAIVSMLDADTCLAEARRADEELARGEYRGWMHGIPHAVKDLANAAGLPTSLGSPIFAGTMPEADDLHIARIRNAGAIFIGKTNVPEFGMGSQSYNSVFGVTRNAYEPALAAGGSSGGAAAGMAIQMLPIADGSDMVGSLRNPANFCNVVGLRPAPGRVPRWPAVNAWGRLSVQGPMARTVAEAALMLSAIAGPDPRAPLAIREPGRSLALPLERDFKGVTIAWSRDFGGLPVDPDVTSAIEAKRGVFDDLGMNVIPGEPDFAGADEVFKTLRAWSFIQGYGDLLEKHRDQIKDTVIWNLEAGMALSGPQVARAEMDRTTLYHRVRRFMERHEFMVFPVSQVPPFDVNTPYPTEIDGVRMETYIDWMKSCYYVTVTGLPAISVPCGFTSSGLPVGLQIVGRHEDELGVLQLAHAFEQATQTWKVRPSVAGL